MADTHAKHHDYHLVNPSPWPAVGATAAFITAVGLIIWMRSMGGAPGLFGLKGPSVFFVGVLGLLYTMIMWWRDVIKEAHGGDHTPVVQLHLRYGMILFIASEVMFFVAWFWAYFDAALFPAAIYPIDVTTPAGTVEAGILGVPDGMDAIEFGLAENARLLRAPHRGGPQFLIQAGVEEDVVGLEDLAGLDDLRVVARQRRAAIAGDIAGRVQPRLLVPQMLADRQPHQRLDAGQVHPAGEGGVFVVQRDWIHRDCPCASS